MAKPVASDATSQSSVHYWRLSLAGGLVVIGAVALLLEALTRTVMQIEQGVSQIWTAGKLIANNTVHIPLLGRTNQIVIQILETSDGIAAATDRIRQAAVGDEEGR